jgi:hypothetical protein
MFAAMKFQSGSRAAAELASSLAAGRLSVSAYDTLAKKHFK